MEKRLQATHEILYQAPAAHPLNYFGWPTVARLTDGALVVGVSGFRNAHVCPWGQSVLFTGDAEGRNWSMPQIVNNSPIDDRDCGVTALDDGKYLISWFTSDTRHYFPSGGPARTETLDFRGLLDSWDEAMIQRYLGSFVRVFDGTTWGKAVAVAVTAPHGPIRLRNGDLFYLGNAFGRRGTDGVLHFAMKNLDGSLPQALLSRDGGKTWADRGGIPAVSGVNAFCEPHAIELNDGRILGLLRTHTDAPHFSIWQTISADGGMTWSVPYQVAAGSPPHLLRHSSGLIIGSYGYREPGFGQRAMFSTDDGKTWDTDWIIRDDGPSSDLGYPSSVELSDGSIYTVYYQAPAAGLPCGVLASRWQLPARITG